MANYSLNILSDNIKLGNTYNNSIQLKKHPCRGFEAFYTCINRLFPDGGTIWLKQGNNAFFTGEVDQSGRFSIHATTGQGETRKKTIEIPNAYEFLLKKSQTSKGGVFALFHKPKAYPLKTHCEKTNDVGVEMDHGSSSEQWDQLNDLFSISGLVPDLVINSGGKSIHAHYRLTRDYPTEQIVYLQRLITILLRSDPVVCRPHQPMRIAGFFRKEKGKEQTLDFYSEESYDLETFIKKLEKAFASRNIVFPKSISDDQWTGITREIKTQDNEGLRSLLQNLQKTQKLKHTTLGKKSTTNKTDRLYDNDLSEFIRNILYPKLTADLIFGDLEGWKGTRINAWCPFCTEREKAPSFSVSDEKHVFNCFGCESSGNWIQYIQKTQNKTFREAVDYLSDLAGVRQEQQKKVVTKKDILDWHHFQDKKHTKIRNGRSRAGCLDKIFSRKTDYIEYDLQRDNATRLIEKTFREKQKQHPNQINVVLFTAPMGIGKTHSGSEINPNQCWLFTSEKEKLLHRLFYVCQSARNPNNANIETKFAELPARTETGYYLDHETLTPAGKAKRSPYTGQINKFGGSPRTQANCVNADKFRLYREKGIATEGLCAACHFAEKCKIGSGSNHGYLYETKEALTSQFIRSHITAIAPDMIGDHDILSIDEWLSLEIKQTNTVEGSDIEKSLDNIKSLDEQLYQIIKPYIEILADLLRESRIAPKNKKNQSDRSHLEILNKLGTYPTEINPFLTKLESLGSPRDRETNQKTTEELKGILIKNWVLEFLNIWKQQQPSSEVCLGHLQVSNGSLVITTPNQRTIDTLRKFKKVLILDATPPWDEIEYVFNGAIATLTEIHPKTRPLSNITILSVKVPDFSSSATVKDQKALISHFTKWIKEKFSTFSKSDCIIGFQGAELYYWGNHSRGYDGFNGKPYLMALGEPNPNLNASKALYSIIYNRFDYDNQSFQDFYDAQTVREVVQCDIGRQRAIRYPDKDFIFIHINGNLPLKEIAEYYGCRYEEIDGINLSSLAGEETYQTRSAIGMAALSLKLQNKPITQQAISEKTRIPLDTLKNQFRAGVSQISFTDFFNFWSAQPLTSSMFECISCEVFSPNTLGVKFPLYITKGNLTPTPLSDKTPHETAYILYRAWLTGVQQSDNNLSSVPAENNSDLVERLNKLLDHTGYGDEETARNIHFAETMNISMNEGDCGVIQYVNPSLKEFVDWLQDYADDMDRHNAEFDEYIQYVDFEVEYQEYLERCLSYSPDLVTEDAQLTIKANDSQTVEHGKKTTFDYSEIYWLPKCSDRFDSEMENYLLLVRQKLLEAAQSDSPAMKIHDSKAMLQQKAIEDLGDKKYSIWAYKHLPDSDKAFIESAAKSA